jgi:hypothetical protein
MNKSISLEQACEMLDNALAIIVDNWPDGSLLCYPAVAKNGRLVDTFLYAVDSEWSDGGSCQFLRSENQRIGVTEHGDLVMRNDRGDTAVVTLLTRLDVNKTKAMRLRKERRK